MKVTLIALEQVMTDFTSDREWRVMISSTMRDLQDERQHAFRAIEAAGMTPWWTEQPPAPFRNLTPEAFCKQMAEKCDIYVLILGGRYGYLPNKQPTNNELSVTHMEYRWAKARSRSKILVFIGRDALDSTDPRQQAFVSEVQNYYEGYVRPQAFTSPGDLEQQVYEALVEWAAQESLGVRLYAQSVIEHHSTFLDTLTKERRSIDSTVPLKVLVEPNQEAVYSGGLDARPINHVLRTVLRKGLPLIEVLVDLGGVEDIAHAVESVIDRPLSILDWLASGGNFDNLDEFIALHAVRDETWVSVIDNPSRLLKEYSRLVLIGDPGAGKTTFMKQLACDVAERRLQGGSRLYPLIPMYITATDVLELLESNPSLSMEDLVDAASHAGTSSDGAGIAMHAALASGNLVLLVDGMDEIASPLHRGRIVSMLSDTKYASAVVMAARTVLLTELSAPGWRICHLQALEESQRIGLIESTLQRYKPDGESATQAVALSQMLQDRADVRAWAGNPLLLTLLTLQYILHGTLPEGRAPLYRRAIEAMIDPPTRPLPPERQRLSQPDMINTLARLAFDMTETGDVSVTRERIKQSLAHVITSASLDDVNELLDRCAVLTPQSHGYLGFIHLTFQEYCCAVRVSQLSEEAQRDLVLRHRFSARWDQVTRLLMGELDQSDKSQDADNLIRALMEADKKRVSLLRKSDPLHLSLLRAALCQKERIASNKAPSLEQSLRSHWYALWQQSMTSIASTGIVRNNATKLLGASLVPELDARIQRYRITFRRLLLLAFGNSFVSLGLTIIYWIGICIGAWQLFHFMITWAGSTLLWRWITSTSFWRQLPAPPSLQWAEPVHRVVIFLSPMIQTFTPALLLTYLLSLGVSNLAKKMSNRASMADQLNRAMLSSIRLWPESVRLLISGIRVLLFNIASARRWDLLRQRFVPRFLKSEDALQNEAVAHATVEYVAKVDPLVEPTVYWILGQVGLVHPNLSSKIIDASYQPDPFIRGAALVMIGLSGSIASNRLAELARALEDENKYVQVAAWLAIRALGSEAAALLPALLAEESNSGKRELAVYLIGCLGESAVEYLPVLWGDLHSADASAVENAARSLLRLGQWTDTLLPLLLQEVREGDHEVRLRAIQILGNLKEAAEPALPLLVDALGDPEQDIASAAAEALGNLGRAASSVVPALRSLIASGDSQTKIRCLSALGAICAAELMVPEELLNALFDNDEDVQLASLRSLMQFGRLLLPHLETLLIGLSSSSDAIRSAVVETIATLGIEAAPVIPRFLVLLGDERPSVRRATALALGRVGITSRDAMLGLIEALNDPEEEVQSAASDALVRMGPALILVRNELNRLATRWESSQQMQLVRVQLAIEPREIGTGRVVSALRSSARDGFLWLAARFDTDEARIRTWVIRIYRWAQSPLTRFAATGLRVVAVCAAALITISQVVILIPPSWRGALVEAVAQYQLDAPLVQASIDAVTRYSNAVTFLIALSVLAMCASLSSWFDSAHSLASVVNYWTGYLLSALSNRRSKFRAPGFYTRDKSEQLPRLVRLARNKDPWLREAAAIALRNQLLQIDDAGD